MKCYRAVYSFPVWRKMVVKLPLLAMLIPLDQAEYVVKQIKPEVVVPQVDDQIAKNRLHRVFLLQCNPQFSQFFQLRSRLRPDGRVVGQRLGFLSHLYHLFK